MTGAFTFPRFDGEALCAETDPEGFFPEKGGSTRAAKGICARCEVQDECLTWALDADERFGVWGGKSERQRREIQSARRRYPVEFQRLVSAGVNPGTAAELAGVGSRRRAA